MLQRFQIDYSFSIKAFIIITGFLFFSLAGNAQEKSEMQTIEIAEEQIAEVQSGSSVTVFIKARFTRRTNGAAKALTKSHAEHEEQGYRFVDLEPYNENGDLQGFFVTYTKE